MPQAPDVPAPHGPTVLVTGGYGLLGSWLVRHFLEIGWQPTVLARRPSPIFPQVPFLQADITQPEALARVLEGQMFDYVVHAASFDHTTAHGYERQSLEVNAIGTVNLVEAIADRLTRPAKGILYTSSYLVYGPTKSESSIFHEDDCPHLNTFYSLSKYTAEKAFHLQARRFAIPHTVVRLTNCYGTPLAPVFDKHYTLLPDLCRSAVQDKTISLHTNGLPQRDFLWLGDACRAIASLLVHPDAKRQTINLGSGELRPLMEVAQVVQQAYGELFGETLSIEINPADTTPATQHHGVDTTRLRTLLPDFHPTNHLHTEALKLLKWFQTTGPLPTHG